MDIEPLHIDGETCGFLTKGDVDEAELKAFLLSRGWIEEMPESAQIEKAWYRKVPARDECNEYCGWNLRDAKPKSRGAFFATQLILI